MNLVVNFLVNDQKSSKIIPEIAEGLQNWEIRYRYW